MNTVTLPEQLTEKKQGKLTIFFSYFTGAGKSYSMLESAEQARQAGLDVVIGLLSCEQWPQTQFLAKKFEVLPYKTIIRAGRTDYEMDLDACLKRAPDLILVDDLSHLNMDVSQKFEVLPYKTIIRAGRTDYEMDLDACLKRAPDLILVDDLSHLNMDVSRHMKRYQDIAELLKAGVDVYTTLNVQHIESIQDTVFSILGSSVSERIPDRVFDQADQVEFIDIEPERLQQRLLQQKKGDLLSDCTLSQLSALREIGLRRCADRAALYTQGYQSKMEYRTREHILVCLSSAPSNEKIIRTAARMASAFRCGFTALFVETKEFQWMPQTDKERLQTNIHLAQQLGASIETVYGDDVAYQIAEFSRLSGVTKIVLGRSGIPHHMLFRKPSLTERLIELIPELDIHIIPDNGLNGRFAAKHREIMHLPTHHMLFRKPSLTERLIELIPELDIHIIPDNGLNGRFAAKHREIMHLPTLSILDLLKSALLLVLATVIGFLFYHLGFTEANIITLYILGVMLVSISTKSSVCSFIASFVRL